MKWYAIMMVGVVVAFCGQVMMESYNSAKVSISCNNLRAEAIKAKITPIPECDPK